jgi:CheY-like chemotaxis protein
METKTVLICDDEVTLCDLIAEHCELMGYKAITANSGEEALTLLKRVDVEVDLVITDMRMSRGNGSFILANIRRACQNKAKIPSTIVMTAYSDKSEKSLIAAGASVVLSKPLNFNVLFNEIKMILQCASSAA